MDDGPDSFELQATGPTFLNVAMKDTVLHEEPWHGGYQVDTCIEHGEQSISHLLGHMGLQINPLNR